LAFQLGLEVGQTLLLDEAVTVDAQPFLILKGLALVVLGLGQVRGS
jgi:hypothetical protein